MIEVKNLVKKYGDHLAVNDLSFTIEPGKIYGFLGPNGAGKSTTMNIITGYLAATEGQVLINGHDITEEPEEAKKCIGYLPEIPPLYMDMTPKEYLEFAADLKGIPKAKRKESIDQVVKMAGIEDVFLRSDSRTFPKVISRESVLPRQFSDFRRLLFSTNRLSDWIRSRSWKSGK